LSNQSKPGELDQATRLVRRICRVAGDPRLIDKLSRDLATRGVRSAIRRHDTGVLFDWLLETISYQGIGNHVAHGYMQRHGRVRWNDIAALLKVRPSCPKLQSYWHFDHCGYQKVERCCAEPDHFAACPLPTHDLRNGRLNQAAYSLVLFMRDVANGDFVGWIDRRLADADLTSAPDRPARLRQAVVEPLTHAYGVSNKVLSMALANFLLAGDARRVVWIEAGAVMIAVDTLVHNFLHRTGILGRLRRGSPLWTRLLRAGRLRRNPRTDCRQHRCPPVQPGLPCQLSPVRAARGVGFLCRGRARPVQRPADR
jgi:hypothetical protein